jgi:predicted DCC family thiol-disulfide oxidoreductase YuxK
MGTETLPFRMPRDTCYFDGKCGLCRRSTRWLARLDWLHRLDFTDMTLVPPADLPVPWEAALRGMPMRTRDGRALVGFPAVRRALLQTPLGILPAALLYVPGLSHAAGAAYQRIADRRARDGCAVQTGSPPAFEVRAGNAHTPRP